MRRLKAMTLVSTGIVALLAVLALPLTGRQTTHAAPEQVYLALGDSIAAGMVTSLPRDRGFPWLVRNLIEQGNAAQGTPTAVTLVNLAVPGETTTSFLMGSQLERAESEIDAARARGAEIRAVTVTLGGNDLLHLAGVGEEERQAGLTQFQATYPAVVRAVKNALGDLSADIVLTTYYDLSQGNPDQQGSDAWWVRQFNDVIRQTAEAEGAKVADLEEAFRGHITEWTWMSADVHPNNDGHYEIARLVWQALGYDQSAPTVTIERPTTGQLARRTPTIRVTATDDIGVTAVELLVDGAHVADLLYVPDEDAYLGVWDARNWTEGTATLTVRATDLAGHESFADVTVGMPER